MTDGNPDEPSDSPPPQGLPGRDAPAPPAGSVPEPQAAPSTVSEPAPATSDEARSPEPGQDAEPVPPARVDAAGSAADGAGSDLPAASAGDPADGAPSTSVEDVPVAPEDAPVAPEAAPVATEAAPTPAEAGPTTAEAGGGVGAAGPDDEQTAPPRGRRRRTRALAAVLAALVLAGAGLLLWSPWSGLPDDAAFRAAGTVVTEVQVQRRTEVLGALYGVQVPEDPDRLDMFRRDTAKAMAISLVLDRAAAAEGIRTADKAVSDALDRFLVQRYPEGGRAAYVQALTAQGVGEQDVLDEIRRQLEVRELFDRTTEDVTVSDSALEALFRADPAQYAAPEQRQLRHVVVADLASAQAVLRRLLSGEDFAAVAAQTSLDGSTKDSGGDLGLLAATELEPSFADAAFAAPPATAFGPVQTSLGWHVGRVDRVVAGSPTTFDQVREQLREQQETERAVAVWREFVLERLEAAAVEYAPDYRPDDLRPDLDGEPDAPATPSPSAAG